MEPGTKARIRNLFQKKGSSNKSHSCLLILPQAQPIFSGEGPRKDPLLSLGTDTHWVTCQYSFLFHVSHNPHLKKKNERKKSTTPLRTLPPPTSMGENGVQHIRFRKKPGTEKEAGWVLSILVRLRGLRGCHLLLEGLHSAVAPQCFSAASSHQPRLRWVQGGMGGKEEGTRG